MRTFISVIFAILVFVIMSIQVNAQKMAWGGFDSTRIEFQPGDTVYCLNADAFDPHDTDDENRFLMPEAFRRNAKGFQLGIVFSEIKTIFFNGNGKKVSEPEYIIKVVGPAVYKKYGLKTGTKFSAWRIIPQQNVVYYHF
ncbi:MAG: hypothetical protein AAB503_00925 [Patescibacteria group bacterium]